MPQHGMKHLSERIACQNSALVKQFAEKLSLRFVCGSKQQAMRLHLLRPREASELGMVAVCPA
jgi:hypothetical protein